MRSWSSATDSTVGDVLYAKRSAGEIPPLVTVETHQKVRDAVQQGFAPRNPGDDPAEPDESLPPPPGNPC